MKKSLLIILFALSTTLCACSQKADTVSEKEETTTAAVAETKEANPTPEPTAEPTPAPIPEPTPIVYEGIDMESTLPGTEWLATFEGIINEPKMVIFNDKTNKKVIVEEGQEVDFATDDIFAIYTPINESTYIIELDSDTFNNIAIGEAETAILLREPSKRFKIGDNATTTNIVEFKEERITLTAILNFVD